MNDFKAVQVEIGKHSLFLISFPSYSQRLKKNIPLPDLVPQCREEMLKQMSLLIEEVGLLHPFELVNPDTCRIQYYEEPKETLKTYMQRYTKMPTCKSKRNSSQC